jgi:hypothetical protein
MGAQPYGEDLEQIQHFHPQEEHGNHHHQDRSDFAETEAVTSRFRAPGQQTQDI